MTRARKAALLQIKFQGSVPVHHILDNNISKAYKEEIKEIDMTYQLVPKDNRWRNIVERAIRMWKTIVAASSAVQQPCFPTTCGTKSYPKQSVNACCLDTPTSTHM